MASEWMEIAQVLINLQNKGAKLAIITSKSLGLKGKGSLQSYTNMNGIDVYRLYRNPTSLFVFPNSKLKESIEIGRKFKPDLIFCGLEFNMRLALKLQKYLQVPILLGVEDAGRIKSGERPSSILKKFLLRLFGIPTGPEFWNWLCKNSSAVVTHHPRDRKSLHVLSGCNKPVYHLFWATYVPEGISLPEKVIGRGVYVGSLYPFKNTQQFEHTLPRIIRETPTKEFIVVGPGPHARIIQKLEKETKGAVKYIPKLPRAEALRLIASSQYAYTPVNWGGWGFIGDCWSVNTPVVMTHNDDYVENGVNAVVAKDEDDLISCINHLYENPQLQHNLQTHGYEESKKRTADAVSKDFFSIFETTLRLSTKDSKNYVLHKPAQKTQLPA